MDKHHRLWLDDFMAEIIEGWVKVIMENWNQDQPKRNAISTDDIQKVRAMESLPVINAHGTTLFVAESLYKYCKHIEALKLCISESFYK